MRAAVSRAAVRLALALAASTLPAFLAALPGAAQEVATVSVQGQSVFPVVGLQGVNAATRAQRIAEALEARLDSDAPLAPLRVVFEDSSAALTVGQDTLLRVTPRDAEVVLNRPVPSDAADAATLEVAGQWAERLAELFGRVAYTERARVVVQGIPLFEVGGTPELRAPRRAEAVGVQIAGVAAAPGLPPEIRVATRGETAAVMAGDSILLEVSAAEAAAFETTAEELASRRAAAIRNVVATIREESSWGTRLRLGVLALAAALLALVLNLALGRLSRRIGRRAETRSDHGTGLAAIAWQWAVSVVRFFVWLGLGVVLLWLFPGTRPITFAAGARAVELFGESLVWLQGEGVALLVLFVVTLLVARFAGIVVRQLIRTLGARSGGRGELRAETLEGTVAAGVQTLVFFFGLLVVLDFLEVDLLPVLASAGVAGIAIGFGVQSLIRDFFTGVFILLEDQYGVGDVIQVGGVTGKVERFTLRITQIRSLDGSLTSVPNGEITTVTNLSRDWSQVVLDANILLGEDVDRALAVIEKAAHELAEAWGDRIQGDPEVLGVETVDPLAQAVTIRVVLRTAPLERWNASRELRRRILDAFREAEIQVPPRAVVTVGSAGPPAG